ncbi:MAG: aminotransferase class I/II-fold pyridoxal phosphate-dependent enzyme [Vicinamibacterales bacterium]
MSVSRRAFFDRITGKTPRSSRFAAAVSARGREAWVGEFGALDFQAAAAAAAGDDPEPLAIRLSSNENPLGPSPAALEAIEGAFQYAGRYPMNAKPAIADFQALVARRFGLETTQVALGAGSGEVLDAAVKAFTGPGRGLVTGNPSYEDPTRVAKRLKVPLAEVPVDEAGRLDLPKMIDAARGQGLVFLCNPNNPTATVHPAAAIEDTLTKISQASPDTVVLLDEAYHEYVTDPGYASGVSLIPKFRNLIVSRTMSKCFGMAGLRLGYVLGQPETVAKVGGWLMAFSTTALTIAAGVASLQDEAGVARERDRNTAAKKFTLDFFQSAGYSATDSQTNFIFVKLGRPAKAFRDACQKQGILVGRDFPPMEKTHCRISIGTMEEMEKAVDVFKSVL